MTNSEIRALHDLERIPRRPIFDADRPYTPIVNQVIDRIHTVRPDGSDLTTPNPSVNTAYPFFPKMSGSSATITYGTLNGVAPTNINNTFTISTSGTRYLVLNATASSGDIVSSSLSVTSTPPTPPGTSLGFPPNSFDLMLYIVKNGTPYRTIGLGSVYAVVHEAYRVQKSMTTPDMLPYDSYYTWLISNA